MFENEEYIDENEEFIDENEENDILRGISGDQLDWELGREQD